MGEGEQGEGHQLSRDLQTEGVPRPGGSDSESTATRGASTQVMPPSSKRVEGSETKDQKHTPQERTSQLIGRGGLLHGHRPGEGDRPREDPGLGEDCPRAQGSNRRRKERQYWQQVTESIAVKRQKQLGKEKGETMNSAGTEVKIEPSEDEELAEEFFKNVENDISDSENNHTQENDDETIKTPKVKLLYPDEL